MEKIYSKVKPEKLLHIIWNQKDGDEGKMNYITSEEESLQAAVCIFPPKEHTFGGPHRHLSQRRETNNTQEAFVILKGEIEASLYDFDDKLIKKEILKAGDLYIYLGGGHGFKVLTPDTLFYEFKNGPYTGKDNDKTFID